MIIFREKEIKQPNYVVELDSGVVIYVYDSYAEGSDGNLYRCVEEKVQEDEYEIIGWCQV